MPPYVESVLTVVCIYSIVTIGLQITVASGQFSVMHAALMGAGGYASGIASVQYHAPFAVALVVGVLAGASIGVVVAIVLRRTSGLLLGTVTVALGESMSLIAQNSTALGASQGYTGIPLVTSLPWAAAALVLSLALVVLIGRSRTGYAILAVGKDETVARSLGISVERVRAIAFGIGGGLAGLGGGLLAHNNGLIEPSNLAFSAEPLFFVFLIVGGLGSPWGAVLGTLLMWWLQELLRFGQNGQLLFLSQADRYWVLGLILIVVVVARPDGLLSRRATTYPRDRARPNRAEQIPWTPAPSP
jgi:branched-chain amino acid transport system permease protein